MTNDDQQLILTCINALSDQVRAFRAKLDSKAKVAGPLEWDWATAAYVVNGKRITPEFIEMIAEFGPSVEVLRQEMREGIVAQDIGRLFDNTEKRFDEMAIILETMQLHLDVIENHVVAKKTIVRKRKPSLRPVSRAKRIR